MKQLLPFLLLCPAPGFAAVPATCLDTAPVPLLVRVGAAPPTPAQLIGGTDPAMRIVDAGNGALLWSASASGALQGFDAMDAAFSGSFIALDLDHDGLHDRLYAGDLAGRLWRFDLHHGAAPGSWASGGVLADFSNTAGRGFVAAPDVSLGSAPGSAPWFNIAIGTAAPGIAGARNRFYVMRDNAPFEVWSDQQYLDWQPLTENELQQVDPARPGPVQNEAGWFLVLDQGEVLTASLTVSGRTLFAISDPSADAALGCRSAFDLVTVMPVTGAILNSGDQWRRPLGGDLPVASAFTLTTLEAEARALCAFGTVALPECDVDLGQHRTWWRRGDAE